MTRHYAKHLERLAVAASGSRATGLWLAGDTG
jgi:hypothetical protein